MNIKNKNRLDQLHLLIETAKEHKKGTDLQDALTLFLEAFDPHNEFAELNVKLVLYKQ